MENGSGTNMDDIAMTEVETTTVYHKLGSLCSEIEDNIRLVSGQSLTVQNDILRLRSESFKQSSPEAEYAIQLFRHYVRTSTQSNSKVDDEPECEDTLNLLSEIPSYVYQGSGSQLVGMESVKKNIFWYRCAVVVFSFFCFILMSAVPHIHDRRVSGIRLFDRDCPYAETVHRGRFSYVPFQYVLAIAVFLFLYAGFIAGYYVLPLNTSGVKYIPGSSEFLVRFLNPVDVVEGSNKFFMMMRRHVKTIEVLGDGGLLLMNIIAFTIAAKSIEEAVAFKDVINDEYIYYSLSTFVQTYTHSHPVCISSDPISLIRASLWMCFFATVALFLSFQVSVRSFYLEQKQLAATAQKQDHFVNKA